MMERRVRGNLHARCEAGEKVESGADAPLRSYLSPFFVYSKMRNVSGISQTEAQKSTDLYMKGQYLDDVTDRRGMIFATGTPISNSMVELFTMQRYLQSEALKLHGLSNFDEWA